MPMPPGPPPASLPLPTLTPTSQRKARAQRRIVQRQRAEVRVRPGESWVAFLLALGLVVAAAMLLAFPGDTGLPASWQQALTTWRDAALAMQIDGWPVQVWAPAWALLRAPFAALGPVEDHALADPITAALVLSLAGVMGLRTLRSLGWSPAARWALWLALFANPYVLLSAGVGTAAVVLLFFAVMVLPPLWRWTPDAEAGTIITAGLGAGISVTLFYPSALLVGVLLPMLYIRARSTQHFDRDAGREATEAVSAILFTFLVPVLFGLGLIMWSRWLAVGEFVDLEDPLLGTAAQHTWWQDLVQALVDASDHVRAWTDAGFAVVAGLTVVIAGPLGLIASMAGWRRRPAAGASLVALAVLAVSLVTLLAGSPLPFVGMMVGGVAAGFMIGVLALTSWREHPEWPAAASASTLAYMLAAGTLAGGTAAVVVLIGE